MLCGGLPSAVCGRNFLKEICHRMPKKTRKAKMRAAQRPIKAGYPSAAGAGAGRVAEPTRETFAPRPVAPSVTASRSASTLTFDYKYVYQDLRRIGLLAGLFFVLMFILWFLVEVQGIHLIPGLL
jgi:hypothetical protein